MDRSRGVGRDVGIVLGSFVVLGVGAGVLWWVLAPTASFTKVRTGGAMSEIELGVQFAAVGWYVVIGAVAGLLAGVVLTWWRDRDALLTSLLVLGGSVVAALLMMLVGHQLGPTDPEVVLATARVGARVPDALHLTTWSAYLAWPVAALAGTLVVLWGRAADLPADDASRFGAG